jgi:hypothetical protein
MAGHIVLYQNPIQLFIKGSNVDSRYFAMYFASEIKTTESIIQSIVVLIRTAVVQSHNKQRRNI